MPTQHLEDVRTDDTPAEEAAFQEETTQKLRERAGLDATTAGGSMAATETEAPPIESAGGAKWAGVIAQEGVDTGDGRRIEKDALGWRELPLTLMGQKTTPEWGGHTDAAVCGRIDSITRTGENITASGVFDTGEWGADIERMVRDQMLRGISVDLAINEAEVIPAEDVDDPMEAWFMGTLVVLDGTILGATIVPFPAFENASVAIVAGAAMRIVRPRWEQIDGERKMVVSFNMPFAPAAPPPPPADDAAECVADLTDTVNLWPGMDGDVVVTIDGESTTIPFPAEESDEADDAAQARREVDVALGVLRDHILRRRA